MERPRFLNGVSDRALAKAQEFSVERNWKSSLRKAGKKAALVGSGLVFIASVNLGSVNNTDASYPDQPSPTPLPKPTLVVKDNLSSSLVTNKKATNISKESTTNLEAQEVIINDYSIEDLRATNDGHVIGLATFPDGAKHVITGDLDPTTGQLNLTEKGIPPLYPLSVARSQTDPNIMIVVGDQARAADKGRIWKTTDGGTNWQLLLHDQGGTMFAVQITPDNIYSFISESNHYQENGVLMARLNLATNQIDDLPVTGVLGGEGVGSMTEYVQNQPGTYTSYGLLPVYLGYQKITVDQTSAQAQELNPQEGYARGDLTTFTDSLGRNRVMLINNDTSDPNNPDRRLGTLFDNINDQMAPYRIQPTTSLYTEADPKDSICVVSAAQDTGQNTGYMGTTIIIGQQNAHLSHIETFSISNPPDTTKRTLIPNDGDWPVFQDPNVDLVDVRYLNVIVKGGKRFLTASVKKSEWVCDPATMTCSVVFRSGGEFVRDTTNGINSTDVWKKMTVSMTPIGKPNNKTFIPFVRN